MKFINDDGSVYNAIPKFIEQLKIKDNEEIIIVKSDDMEKYHSIVKVLSR